MSGYYISLTGLIFLFPRSGVRVLVGIHYHKESDQTLQQHSIKFNFKSQIQPI